MQIKQCRCENGWQVLGFLEIFRYSEPVLAFAGPSACQVLSKVFLGLCDHGSSLTCSLRNGCKSDSRLCEERAPRAPRGLVLLSRPFSNRGFIRLVAYQELGDTTARPIADEDTLKSIPCFTVYFCFFSCSR